TPGNRRTGAAIAVGGTLLLATTLTRAWSQPATIPSAIAVALIVFGAFLLTQPIAARLNSARRPLSRFDGHPEPVFLTDAAGRVLARNAAAPRRSFLEPWLPDADAALYRLTRAARINGIAATTAADGLHRIIATSYGRRRLLWRVERLPSGGNLSEISLPWLRIDASGAVSAANPTATAILGEADRIEAGCAVPPLRSGGVPTLTASGEPVRATVHDGEDEHRDLLLVPLGDAEIAGLVLDHFLEERPVALARLETDGQLVYANRAARKLLGDGVQPGINIATLIEGLG